MGEVGVRPVPDSWVPFALRGGVMGSLWIKRVQAIPGPVRDIVRATNADATATKKCQGFTTNKTDIMGPKCICTPKARVAKTTREKKNAASLHTPAQHSQATTACARYVRAPLLVLVHLPFHIQPDIRCTRRNKKQEKDDPIPATMFVNKTQDQ